MSETTALDALGRIEDPVERQQFYVKNRGAAWGAAKMAYRNQNSLGGMFGSVLAEEAVTYFGSRFAAITAFGANFATSAASPGETYVTRLASSLTATDMSSGYAAQDATSTQVAVQLTVNKVVSVGINDVESTFSGGTRAFQKTFVAPMIEAVSKPVFDAIWALVLAANYPTSQTITAANFDADALADLSATLSAAGAPHEGRSAILASSYYAGVGKSAVVSDASAYGSTDPIRELIIPRVRGFEVFDYLGTIPDNSQNLASVVCHSAAMALAARVPPIPPATVWGGSAVNTVDPISMLPMQFRTWYTPDSGKWMFSVGLLFGAAVAQPDALIRITSA